MKIVYVVDSISNLNQKINLIKNNFGDNIYYVVRADLLDLFKTYGLIAHATYYNNLAKVIHVLLINGEIDDLLICHASMPFDDNLLRKFRSAIGNKTKIVGIMPKYSYIEQLCNSTYNVYVKSLFNTKDSLISNKLQFIPSQFIPELLSTHISNRLFEIAPEHTKNIELENKEINKKLKSHTVNMKYNLIAIIFALLTTILFIATIAYFKAKFISILICVILYLTDIVLTIIFHCKSRFDQRFFK